MASSSRQAGLHVWYYITIEAQLANLLAHTEA